jgi:uncharacterized protein
MNTRFSAASISCRYWPRIKLRSADISIGLISQKLAGRLSHGPNLIRGGTTCDKIVPYISGALHARENAMTPQERQLIDDLFERISKLENAPRDSEAMAAIAQGLRQAPNAVYALVQTVLLQDEALKRANSRIQELEAEHAPGQSQSGGFLDSMRETIFGQSQPRGSVPNVQPPEMPSRPVWNSGQALQQAQHGGPYDQEPYAQSPYPQHSYPQASYPQAYGGPQPPMGGGGSFLGTAAAAAAGVVGGSLLLGSIRSMMGGGRQAFGDAAGLGNRTETKPWGDQSNSDLARDAGIQDIGSSGSRAGDTARDDNSRAGLFDSASNDDDRDAMDMDSDDVGGDGGSDYA